jgi:excisionase family DNA binding protein
MTTDDATGLLTTADALVYLRTTSRTLYRHLAAGDIPGVRVGHQWRFRKQDLDRWLTGQSRSASRVAAASSLLPAGRRALVVDDEAEMRQLLGAIFLVNEFVVDEAPDGPSALDRLRTSTYDLLVTDLRMPGIDGTMLAREAKRLRPDIKILIVTGCPSESSAIEAVNIGVDGYLMKPFNPVDVLAAAARALNSESPHTRQWAPPVNP